MKRKIWKWLKIIVLVYVLLGIALYLLQDKLLFHPKKLPADHRYEFGVPFRETNLLINEKEILSIGRFRVPDSTCKGVVLYFHGNRENINRYAPYARHFTDNGYEVWMMDYPGFGKSTGKRSEKIMYDDALLLYKMAIQRFAADSIIIYGKSIGTGVAAHLAMVRDCKRLILETPYYSIDALARHYFFIYPVAPMTKYSFPIHDYLQNVRAPITIFHGTRDEVIPYPQSKKLAKENPKVELITIEKGKHNNLAEFPLFRQKLDSLLRL